MFAGSLWRVRETSDALGLTLLARWVCRPIASCVRRCDPRRSYRRERFALKRIALALVTATVVLFVASPAAAAIKITRIQYNPPGADTGSNAHLNKEWVKIRNTADHSRSLVGWKLRDSDGHLTFINVKLPANTTLTFHTGSGLDSFPHHRYWNFGTYIWSNNGDTAKITKRNGVAADKCHYSGGGRAVRC